MMEFIRDALDIIVALLTVSPELDLAGLVRLSLYVVAASVAAVFFLSVLSAVGGIIRGGTRSARRVRLPRRRASRVYYHGRRP